MPVLEAGQKRTGGVLGDVLRSTQEARVSYQWIALAIRQNPGIWEDIGVYLNSHAVMKCSKSQSFRFKEEVADGVGVLVEGFPWN